jgi:hypothetical protein
MAELIKKRLLNFADSNVVQQLEQETYKWKINFPDSVFKDFSALFKKGKFFPVAGACMSRKFHIE